MSQQHSSSQSNYFSMMLQRVMFEAQGAPSSAGGDLLLAKAKYFAAQQPQEAGMLPRLEDDQTAQKRKNLERTIQRVKSLLEQKQQEQPDVIVVDESSCSESGDDVDVVGGDGPTAAEFNLSGDDVVEIEKETPPVRNLVPRPTTHPNECPYCSKVLASPSLLREHVAIMHLNERNFPCEQCSARFGRRGGLRRHMQMVHSNHIYKCSFPGCVHPGYKCSKALQAHVRSVHTKERPFTCEVCAKAFVRKNDLAMHLKTHTKEPSFSCACGTRFRRLVYLKKHQKACYVAISAAAKGDPTEYRNYDDEERDINIEMVKLAQEELINQNIKLDAQQFFPVNKKDDVEVVGVRHHEEEEPQDLSVGRNGVIVD